MYVCQLVGYLYILIIGALQYAFPSVLSMCHSMESYRHCRASGELSLCLSFTPEQLHPIQETDADSVPSVRIRTRMGQSVH